MKDNFSQQAAIYAAFRPTYPPELFQYLYTLISNRQCAWDCGTGNGQVAAALADHFDKVYATDISEKQIARAVQKPNIFYSVQRAEQTSFNDNQFGLVTVAQAIHWFKFDEFYDEVKRTLKPGGILAVIGYGLMETSGELNDVIRHFYKNVVGPYWDVERSYIDEEYTTIPFPFEEVSTPDFAMEYDWNIDQLTGYLSTWSSVQHYINKNNTDPLTLVSEQLKQAWGVEAIKKFTFKILLRVGVQS
jgi:SAM-dependent methyltransferase